MPTLSQKTAQEIWTCHREIETAKKLLTQITDLLKEGKDPTPLDTWDRRSNFQLGVPNGDDGHRLFKVAPSMALAVIAAHIEGQQLLLSEACDRALKELAGDVA